MYLPPMEMVKMTSLSPVEHPFKQKSMKIFNRWGQLIFEDYNGIGWDGRLPSGLKASDGTYLYRITIQPATIPISEDRRIEEEGFLQLISR